MSDLKILVAGQSGTGKSTVSVIIQQALKNAGFPNVELIDNETTPEWRAQVLRDEYDRESPTFLLRQNVNVTIDQLQLARESQLPEVNLDVPMPSIKPAKTYIEMAEELEELEAPSRYINPDNLIMKADIKRVIETLKDQLDMQSVNQIHNTSAYVAVNVITKALKELL